MTNWRGKHFLEDIMEAQKLSVKQIVGESGINENWLKDYLNDDLEILIDKTNDELLCFATNQVTGYFYDLDQKYLKSKK